MRRFELTCDENPSIQFVESLEERLYELNIAATGCADGRWLCFVCRDEQGELLGAVCGSTWGGCCDIKQLWVAEAFRGLGLGLQLIQAAEAEARKRSCRQIILTTHSFQAPRFYLRLGFEILATVPDYPVGHQHLLLRKKLLDD